MVILHHILFLVHHVDFCSVANCVYEYQVDLIFAIDTSESSGEQQFFYNILDWVAHIVHRIEFGEDGVRVGIVIFGSEVLVDRSIRLDEYVGNKDGLVEAIKSIPWKSHGTEIGTAIDYVTERFRLDGEFGAREESVKVGVVITDGETFELHPMPVVTAATTAREEGVILHAVGAGESLNLTVLNQIADRPEYVYTNPLKGGGLDGLLTNVSKALLCEIPAPGEWEGVGWWWV